MPNSPVFAVGVTGLARPPPDHMQEMTRVRHTSVGCAAVGVDFSFNWSGQRRAIRFSALEAICAALDCEVGAPLVAIP